MAKKRRTFAARYLSFVNIAYFVVVIVLLGQSLILNAVFQYYITDYGTYPLYVADFIQIAYALYHSKIQYAARMGATIWVSYSWIMAAKLLVVYLKVYPYMDFTSVATEKKGQTIRTPAVVSSALYSMSVVYIMLMFRAAKPLFGSLSKISTPDVIMHQDMLWHVVLDLIDCVNMAQYSRLHDWMDHLVVIDYWDALNMFRRLSPIFVFMAVLAHSQSFPLAEWKFTEVRLDPTDVMRMNEEVVGKENMVRYQQTLKMLQQYQVDDDQEEQVDGDGEPGSKSDSGGVDRESRRRSLGKKLSITSDHTNRRPTNDVYSETFGRRKTKSLKVVRKNYMDALPFASKTVGSIHTHSKKQHIAHERKKSQQKGGDGGPPSQAGPNRRESQEEKSRAGHDRTETASVRRTSKFGFFSPTLAHRQSFNSQNKKPITPQSGAQIGGLGIPAKTPFMDGILSSSKEKEATAVESIASTSSSSSNSFYAQSPFASGPLAGQADDKGMSSDHLTAGSAASSQKKRKDRGGTSSGGSTSGQIRSGFMGANTEEGGRNEGSGNRFLSVPGFPRKSPKGAIGVDVVPSPGEPRSDFGPHIGSPGVALQSPPVGRSSVAVSTGKPTATPPAGLGGSAGRSAFSPAVDGGAAGRPSGSSSGAGPSPSAGIADGLSPRMSTKDNAFSPVVSPVVRKGGLQTNTDAEMFETRHELVGYSIRTQLDVTCARERSAIVSLLLVDLPFGVLRIFLFFVTINSRNPAWPPLAMKNISCFFLQLMQLRVVEQRKNELLAVLSEANEAHEEYFSYRKKEWANQEKFLNKSPTWNLRSLVKLTVHIIRGLWRVRRKNRKPSTTSTERSGFSTCSDPMPPAESVAGESAAANHADLEAGIVQHSKQNATVAISQKPDDNKGKDDTRKAADALADSANFDTKQQESGTMMEALRRTTLGMDDLKMVSALLGGDSVTEEQAKTDKPDPQATIASIPDPRATVSSIPDPRASSNVLPAPVPTATRTDAGHRESTASIEPEEFWGGSFTNSVMQEMQGIDAHGANTFGANSIFAAFDDGDKRGDVGYTRGSLRGRSLNLGTSANMALDDFADIAAEVADSCSSVTGSESGSSDSMSSYSNFPLSTQKGQRSSQAGISQGGMVDNRGFSASSSSTLSAGGDSSANGSNVGSNLLAPPGTFQIEINNQANIKTVSGRRLIGNEIQTSNQNAGASSAVINPVSPSDFSIDISRDMSHSGAATGSVGIGLPTRWSQDVGIGGGVPRAMSQYMDVPREFSNMSHLDPTNLIMGLAAHQRRSLLHSGMLTKKVQKDLIQRKRASMASEKRMSEKQALSQGFASGNFAGGASCSGTYSIASGSLATGVSLNTEKATGFHPGLDSGRTVSQTHCSVDNIDTDYDHHLIDGDETDSTEEKSQVSSLASGYLRNMEFISKLEGNRNKSLDDMFREVDVRVKLRRNSRFRQFCFLFTVGFFLGVFMALQEAIVHLFSSGNLKDTFDNIDMEVFWRDGKGSQKNDKDKMPTRILSSNKMSTRVVSSESRILSVETFGVSSSDSGTFEGVSGEASGSRLSETYDASTKTHYTDGSKDGLNLHYPPFSLSETVYSTLSETVAGFWEYMLY